MLLDVHMPQLTDDPDLYLNYDEPEDEAHGSYKDSSEECDCGHQHHHHHNEDHHGCGCGCEEEDDEDEEDYL